MERNEFIKSFGIGLALVCTGSCLSGCGKGGDGPETQKPPTNPGGNGSGKPTVDLSTQLLNIGDQVTTGGVLFFRTATGNTTSAIVATESVCPHQGGSLAWKQAISKIQCQLHFSEYTSGGAVTQE